MPLKLYEIDEHLEIILNEINRFAEENDGEIPDELDSVLDNLQQQKHRKILDIARYIKSLKYESDSIKVEIDKLTSRRKTNLNYIRRLKQYLKMHLHTGEKLSDNNTKLSWRKTESINVINIDNIPDDYCKIEKTPQLTIIKRQIKSGVIIDGVQLIEKNNLIIY